MWIAADPDFSWAIAKALLVIFASLGSLLCILVLAAKKVYLRKSESREISGLPEPERTTGVDNRAA